MSRRTARRHVLASDPLWYKDAIIYELRVRSFYDSDGDGIGDLRGLTEKLDYLQDLGVTALWLLPFYPSPLRDDGYDISDYRDVHPEVGTLQDFKTFLREAHKRGLRVITELVINHTSDKHPWFQRARRAPAGTAARDFYVWSDTPDRYADARIIFRDFEHSNWSWDPVAKAYYWHRFYSHQPDLNFDSPNVRRAVTQILDFWLEMGVDGLRLDAIPYLFEREGTNCENLPETIEFLGKLRKHLDRKFSNRMLLAEANQWPEDAVAYLGTSGCHMAFHFPIMPRMFMALHMEDRFPITDILAQTPSLDEGSQWALFLRNHDELTLEMVSDEERDYMYRAYARESQMRINLGIRRRLAPLLGNNRRSIELMKGLLLSLPGTPVLYYGDEIGMGDNVFLGDRNGVRTPMQWSADRNAGFSRANAQRLILPIIIDPEYHYEALNVEAQDGNPHSMLWWIRRLIGLRKRLKAFGRGSLEFLNPDNPKVLAFIRAHEEERLLVIANLSRYTQYVELDLSRFRGMVPVELIGGTRFPPVAEAPYMLTLGPHIFHWLSLEQPGAVALAAAAYRPPAISVREPSGYLQREEDREALGAVLPAYLQGRRWFGGKARRLQSTEVVDSLPIDGGPTGGVLHLVRVEYTDGEPEIYALPLGLASADRAAEIRARHPEAIVAELTPTTPSGAPHTLFDAMVDPGFGTALLDLMVRRRRIRGKGQAAASLLPGARSLQGASESLDPKALRAEQSNTSVVYGERCILKMFRKLDEGTSPEVEIGHLLARRSFPHAPPLLGHIDYQLGRGPRITVAVLQGFVPHEQDLWRHTLEELGRYYERVLTRRDTLSEAPAPALTDGEPPAHIADLIGPYLDVPRLLGQRTAELHVALASETENPDFVPEPYSALYQRAMYQSMRTLAGQTFRLLRRRLPDVPRALRSAAQHVLNHEDAVVRCFGTFLRRRISVIRSRAHGDLHLGQVLWTGRDCVIIDFEGEPARPLSDRRRKRSALRDVAGMLRSFHYATRSVLHDGEARGVYGEREMAMLAAWGHAWQTYAGRAFWAGYRDAASGVPIVPRDAEELRLLLDVFMLEKAVYELGYELNNRPDWLTIPLEGISQVLGIGTGRGV